MALGIFSALGTLAISALGTWLSSELTKDTNKEMADYQNDINLQNWQRQNEYNDPSARIQREMAAGINPVAASMSNGQSIGGQASPIAPAASIPPYMDLVSTLVGNISGLSSAFKNAEEGEDLRSTREMRIKNLESQNQQLQNNAKLLGVNATAQETLNKYIDARELWALQDFKSGVELKYSQAAHFRQSVKTEAAKLMYELPANVQKTLTEAKKTALDMNYVLAAIANMEADTNLKQEQKELVEVEGQVQQAQHGLIEAQTEHQQQENANYQQITDTYLQHYQAMISNLAAQTGKTEEETYWYMFDELLKGSHTIFGIKIGESAEKARILRERKFRERVPYQPQGYNGGF